MKGEILKELRLNAHLTQDDLAKKLGIAPSTIRMIELGKRKGSDEVVNKIANYFKVSLDYLNARENDNKKKSELVDEFIDSLINEGIITDSNDIDDDIADMILNAVKAQVALKLKKHNKGDK